MVFPEAPQTLLREHYRCNPSIIGFCNGQFYGGQLLIMKKEDNVSSPLEVIRTKPGSFCNKAVRNLNERQVDIICNRISESGLKPEDVGVMAPYRTQVRAISERLGKEWEVATVHKFQGKERKHMIISTVDDVIGAFTDNPNMLNVAVSRAEDKLSIVISGNPLDPRTNYSSLIRYIEYNNFTISESPVSSVFDFFFTESARERFRLLDRTRKISRFDSENAMYSLITEILDEEKSSRFGVVFEMPLKNHVNPAVISNLPQDLQKHVSNDYTHVDFTIYSKVTKDIILGIEVDGYRYHAKGTRQAERDAMKNRVFDIIGIPLLRFSTRGSGEREAIVAELEKHVPIPPGDFLKVADLELADSAC